MVQSRTPSAQRPPWWSPCTCTSTWRTPSRQRSTKTVESPNVRPASRRALSNAARSSDSFGRLPDAAAAGTGRRLHENRVAEPLGVQPRDVERARRLSAPRRHAQAGLLGQPLRRDLVAHAPQRAAVGADEEDAEPLAQLHEVGPLGHEPPSGPDRVCLDGHQRLLETRRSPGRSASAVRPRRPRRWPVRGRYDSSASRTNRARRSGVGEQGDRADVRAALEVELADGVDRAHRRLAPVDDGDALEIYRHDDLGPRRGRQAERQAGLEKRDDPPAPPLPPWNIAVRCRLPADAGKPGRSLYLTRQNSRVTPVLGSLPVRPPSPHPRILRETSISPVLRAGARHQRAGHVGIRAAADADDPPHQRHPRSPAARSRYPDATPRRRRTPRGCRPSRTSAASPAAPRSSSGSREQQARHGTPVWLVDVGDYCDGTPFSTEYQGEADVAAMNAAGYDFGTLGNHEFNYPAAQVRKLIAADQVPLVCANVTDRHDWQAAGCRPT